MGQDNNEVQPIGWRAIDEALFKLYKGAEPIHAAPSVPRASGGQELLDGISAYKRLEPVPHWHYVTYGFTELYEKETNDSERSGFGFELTLRLKSEDKEPPMWVFSFLSNISNYVFSTGNYLVSGDYLNTNGPIEMESKTELKAVTFVNDPELPEIITPNGKVTFLQVVGITNDEELAIKSWNCSKVMELFSKYLTLYITDLDRKSLLNDVNIRNTIDNGIKEDGSNTSNLFSPELDWSVKNPSTNSFEYVIKIGTRQANDIIKVLPGRFLKQRSLSIIGTKGVLTLKPGLEDDVSLSDGELIITITNDVYDEIMERLISKAKEFTLKSVKGVSIQVEKTEIRDMEGNVIEVIE